MMKRALLSGNAGTDIFDLARHLTAEGWKVSIAAHDSAMAARISGAGYTPVLVSPLESSAVAEAVGRCQMLFQFIELNPADAHDAESFLRKNLIGCLHALDAMKLFRTPGIFLTSGPVPSAGSLPSIALMAIERFVEMHAKEFRMRTALSRIGSPGQWERVSALAAELGSA